MAQRKPEILVPALSMKVPLRRSSVDNFHASSSPTASPRSRRGAQGAEYTYTSKHLSDGLVQPVVLQMRASASTRITVDGAGVEMAPRSWAFFIEQALAREQKTSRLQLVNVNLEPIFDSLLSGLSQSRTLQELVFDRCSGLNNSNALALARVIALQSKLRQFTWTGPFPLPRAQAKVFVAELMSSITLLSLSVPFETDEQGVMGVLAQNQKLGMHLDRPPLSCLLFDRGLPLLPPTVLGILSLTLLDVSGNFLTGVPVGVLALENLVTFNAARNRIAALSFPIYLQQLPRLQSVDFSDNPLCDDLPSDVSPTNASSLWTHFAPPSKETIMVRHVKTFVLGSPVSGRTSVVRSLAAFGVALEATALLSPSTVPASTGSIQVASPVSSSGSGGGSGSNSNSGSYGSSSSPIPPNVRRTSRRLTTTSSQRRSSSLQGASTCLIGGDCEDILVSDVAAEEGFTLRVWDFSSRAIQRGAPPLFASSEGIFIVTFNVQEPDLPLVIDPWVEWIEDFARGASVFFVGTHRDRLANPTSAVATITSQVSERYRRRKRIHFCGVFVVDARTDPVLGDLLVRMCKQVQLQASEASSMIGQVVPRTLRLLPSMIRQCALVNRSFPVVSREDFVDMTSSFGVRRGAPCDEAIAYLSFVGEVLTFRASTLRSFIVLDPGWLCTVLIRLLESDVLTQAGGSFESTRLSRILPLYEIPGNAYAFIIAVFKHFGIVHELRLAQRPLVPPFTSNSMASAFVVPRALGTSSSKNNGSSLFSERRGLDMISASVSKTQLFQRQYHLSHFPSRLRNQLLFRLMDVTTHHSSIWQGGIVCGDGSMTDTLVAEWTGPDARSSTLKLLFVCQRHESAPRFIHMIVVTVEELLERFFPMKDYTCTVVTQSGRSITVDELVGDFLSGSHPEFEKDLRAIAPDLLVQQSLRIDGRELVKERDIGAGSFGTIELHKWRNGQVVLKKLIMNPEENAREHTLKSYREFLRECWMMSLLRHRSVIRLEGVVLEPLSMVLEWCDGGDLRAFLDAHEALEWSVRLAILRDIAVGLNVGHQFSPPIVHRDLKSPNIFIVLSEKYGIEARVGDLGLSTFLAGSYQAQMVDNPTWCAPEVIRKDDSVTEKADVFALAIIMWELLTGKFPYDDLMEEYQFANRLCEGIENWNLRPTLPKASVDANQPAAFVPLMVRCWSQEPTERPSLFEVIHVTMSMIDAEAKRVGENVVSLELSCIGVVPNCTGVMCRSGGRVYVIHEQSRHVVAFDIVKGCMVQCFRTPDLVSQVDCSMVAVEDECCWVATVGGSCVYMLSRSSPTFGGTGICEPRQLVISELSRVVGLAPSLSGACVWVIGVAQAQASSTEEGEYEKSFLAVCVETTLLTVTACVPMGALPFLLCEVGLARDLFVSQYANRKLTSVAMAPNRSPTPDIASPRGSQLAASAKEKLELRELLTPDEVLVLLSGEGLNVSSARSNVEGGPLEGKHAGYRIDSIEIRNFSVNPSPHVSKNPSPRPPTSSLKSWLTDDSSLAPAMISAGTKAQSSLPASSGSFRVLANDTKRLFKMVTVGDELWVLNSGGEILILDVATRAQKRCFQLPMWCDHEDDPLDMAFIDDNRWCVVASLHNIVAVPVNETDEEEGSRRVVHLLTDQREKESPGSFVSIVSIPHVSAFFLSSTRQKTSRWCLVATKVAGVDKIRLQSSPQRRQKTNMEALEEQKRSNNLQVFRQAKGMMLNLDNVQYTTESKPMGLAGMFETEEGGETLQNSSLDEQLVQVLGEAKKPLRASGRTTKPDPSPTTLKKKSTLLEKIGIRRK